MAYQNYSMRLFEENFELIEPFFYREFNQVDPIFSEWTLERMPRNVNSSALQLYRQNMPNDGWLYQSYNTKGKFCCLSCRKNRFSEREATWSSAYTTVLFRIFHGPHTYENGQTWVRGWIQMRFLAQRCSRCDAPVTCVLDNERSQLLVNWLHRFVANKFYGFPHQSDGYRGKSQNREPHRENLCEACQIGWCAYRRRG